jgi:hypothetical protein
VDDSAARNEWDWSPAYDLRSMAGDMVARLRERHERGELSPEGIPAAG